MLSSNSIWLMVLVVVNVTARSVYIAYLYMYSETAVFVIKHAQHPSGRVARWRVHI